MKISKKIPSTLISFSGIFLFAFSFSDTQLISIDAQEFRQAPDYKSITLDGAPVSISDYQGKVILVNLWATWCEPCREEMPALGELHSMFPRSDFEIIGVSIDDPGFEKVIIQIMADDNLTYPVWLDPENRFQFMFRTIGVPESFLIDVDGQIVHQWKGAFDPVSEDTINLVQSTIQGTSYQSSESTILTDGLIAGFAIAFSAGVLSFLSPCVLPLIPVYASLITGMSAKELSQETSQVTRSKLRLTATVKGIMFVIGFSIIFMLLGTTVSFMGNLFFDATQWIERIGGVVLIVLGLHMVGLFKIPRLEKQMRFDMSKRNSGKFGPLVVGMAFGAGWTPCIGPILAGILTIAASSSSVVTGASLLGVYSLGLAIPFLVSAIAIDRFLVFFTKIKSKMLWIEKISGILFVMFGIVLLTGSLVFLNNFFKM
ncbi:MAG: redoxin domain-containing protein [Thaumarchaeota archaeon]|nr:redoxin domain-containing protein [Nitrososphaerota archaeon]